MKSKNSHNLGVEGEKTAKNYLLDHGFFVLQENWRFKKYEVDIIAKKRCDYLRINCDWLVLWLSSGYDSNTVLKYFIESDNKIDEIIVYQRNQLFDNEYITALEIAKNYKKYSNPKLKITWLPMSYDHMIEIYEKLIVLFPEKSSFFALQIENLRK